MTPPEDREPSDAERRWTRKVLQLIGEPEALYVNGAPPVTAAENARLATLTPDMLAQVDLTRASPKVLFSDDYMDRLKDTPIKGEGDPRLRDLMREVERGLSGARRGEVMIALAQIVGVPPTADRLDTDYGRFLIVLKQQEIKGAKKDDDTPPLDEDKHPEFMASRAQLLFGTVIGDAFEIHPVFASLLQPTGGLVGPGNWLVPGVVKARHLDPDNPIALHGVTHDAAGYLLTFHDEGPGYNYLDSKLEILGPSCPLSGQITGIGYWVAEVGDDYILHRTDTALIRMETALQSARDAVAAEIRSKLATAKATARGVVDTARDVVEDVTGAIGGACDAVERSATAKIDSAKKTLGRVRDKAKRKLEAAWVFVWT